jgi:lipoprotein NlpI
LFAQEVIMRVWRKGLIAAASMLVLAGTGADAAAVDDANAAVLAARDGKYEDSIQLFTNAINSDELNLKSRAQAYAYRGIAKATTGDYDGAELDLNSAVALDSDYNADAFAFRGYFRLVRGEPKEGATDLAKSADLLLWPYNVLWLYLARVKAGIADEGAHSLPANADILSRTIGQDGTDSMSRWPAPVVKFMMGQGTRESVRAEANKGDPAKLAERVCDVDFYLAELDLAHGKMDGVKPMLQAAAGKCPFASFERMGATAELARMK